MALLPVDVAPSDRGLLNVRPVTRLSHRLHIQNAHDREVRGRPEADPSSGQGSRSWASGKVGDLDRMRYRRGW
jgi:hypothetical protein